VSGAPRESDTLARLRALSDAARDAPSALRALHAFLAAEFPHCALALLTTRDAKPGTCRLAGLIGPDGHEHMPAVDPGGTRQRLPQFDDAVAARVIESARPHVVDVAPSEAALPIVQALLAPATLLVLPMAGVDGVEFWLTVAGTMHGRFARIDAAALMPDVTLAYRVAAMPVAVPVLEASRRRHQREIEGLADVQRLLQPDNPEIRGLRYALHWQPAETAAGDYYDLMALTQFAPAEYRQDAGDIWAVMLADVSGHGAAAAMEAVQFDAILRTYEGDEPPLGPAGALTYANRYFFSRRQRRHFLTVFALRQRPDIDELEYVCAGHLPAIIRSGGEIRLLGKDHDAGIPLGILREHRWDNHTTRFARGDVLVLYTDGVVEARDRRGRMFGAERVEQLVRDGDPEPDAVLARLREALFDHQRNEVGADDQTIIVLRQA
jgi:sigma-B regulation protein RsbU (phosphoserine phosphatase)